MTRREHRDSLFHSAELFTQAVAPFVARFGSGVGGTWDMKHDQKRDEDDEGLDDVLAQILDRFIIAEEELDGAVHAEYSRYVQGLTSCQPRAAGLEARRTLFDPTASLEVKQEMLARLAQYGTVGAYRAISESSQQGSAECSIACGILWPLASRARHCTTRSDAVWCRHGARYASGTIPSWNRSAFTQTMSSSRSWSRWSRPSEQSLTRVLPRPMSPTRSCGGTTSSPMSPSRPTKKFGVSWKRYPETRRPSRAAARAIAAALASGIMGVGSKTTCVGSWKKRRGSAGRVL